MNQAQYFEEIVVPTEQVVETKGREDPDREAHLPRLPAGEDDPHDDSWSLVKNTPGVTGFVGSENKPTPAHAFGGRPDPAHSTVEKPKAKPSS